MPLRLAGVNDLAAISAICAASFWDEEVVGGTMHPYRHEYPQDYADFWRRRVWEKYWDYGHKMVVFYLDGEGDAKAGEVVGVADWERRGVGWEQVWAVTGWWDPSKFFASLLSLNYLCLHCGWKFW